MARYIVERRGVFQVKDRKLAPVKPGSVVELTEGQAELYAPKIRAVPDAGHVELGERTLETGTNAKETVKLINQCETLEDLFQYSGDERSTVKAAYESRLAALSE